MKHLLTSLFFALAVTASAQTVTLDITWRDTTVIGADMTYAQAKTRWPAWVGYMEYIGASSKVLNIRKFAASWNNAVWANDNGPGVTDYRDGCSSRANLSVPFGVYRVDIELIQPQGVVWGEGSQGFVHSWVIKPGGTTLIYDHAGWDGDPDKRYLIKDQTWGRVDNFGYTEGAQLHGFKIMGQGTGLYDPSYHFSAIGAWKRGEVSNIADVFIYNANNYGIEMGGQFHATFYSERVSIFKCGLGAYGVIGGGHMQVHMGSFDDNPAVFHCLPDASGSIGNGTAIKLYGGKMETGQNLNAERPYSRGQLLVDGEGWIKFDSYGLAYSRVNTKPHLLFRVKSVASPAPPGRPANQPQECRINMFGTTWFNCPAYLLHDRNKGELIPMDIPAGSDAVNSSISSFSWSGTKGVTWSPGVTLTPIPATCDQRLAPLPRDPMTGNLVGSWSGCTPLYSYTTPIASEGGPVQPPPTTTPCTYTTGPWSTCVNGTQTRTVTASPAGCTGTPPPSSQPCTVAPPPVSAGIDPNDVLVVVNSADASSRAMAEAYANEWKIPASNIVTVNLGSGDNLTSLSSLNTARTTINGRAKQYSVLAWSKPSRYGSQSITSAITFGARNVTNLTESVLWKYSGTKPRTDKGVAPSVLLYSVNYIRRDAHGTRPTGKDYQVLAKDQSGTPRGSARAGQAPADVIVWDNRTLSNVGEGNNGCNYLSMSCWVSGRAKPETILTYYGSMYAMDAGAGLTFAKGFYGDNVTSTGGTLPSGAGQTPLTWFLDRGASASVGTVAEPWQSKAGYSPGSLAEQFVDLRVFHPLFKGGSPVGVACWAAVRCPDRAVIVGDLMCAPFGE